MMEFLILPMPPSLREVASRSDDGRSCSVAALPYPLNPNVKKGANVETKQSQTSPAARENIMGTMEINPLLVKLSVPMMISMLVQALYNVVDSSNMPTISGACCTAI